MVTYQSQNGLFTFTIQGDAAGANAASVYSRSKTMLRVRRYDQVELSLVFLSVAWTGTTLSFTYYTNPEGILEIPLRNLINKCMADGYTSLAIGIQVYELDHTLVDQGGVTLYAYDGISYYDTCPPRNKDAQQFLAAYSPRFVMPPNVILNPATINGATSPGIVVESNFQTNDPKNIVWTEIASGVSATITPTGARDNQLVVHNGSDTLQVTDGTNTKQWPLAKADYCTDLVCIRWRSMTGAMRQHFFPIVSFVKGADKQVSIVSAGDGYHVEKNAYNSVKCRLTGLTPYGYWYYMDLLQSSDVHAVITPWSGLWSTEIESEQTRVFIEGDELASPNGNGFFTFEFTMKWRHYDTI